MMQMKLLSHLNTVVYISCDTTGQVHDKLVKHYADSADSENGANAKNGADSRNACGIGSYFIFLSVMRNLDSKICGHRM